MPTKQVSLCRCQSVGDSAYKTGVFVLLSGTEGQCLQNRCLCVVVNHWGTMPIRQASLCRCQSLGDNAYKTGVFVSLSVTEGQSYKTDVFESLSVTGGQCLHDRCLRVVVSHLWTVPT